MVKTATISRLLIRDMAFQLIPHGDNSKNYEIAVFQTSQSKPFVTKQNKNISDNNNANYWNIKNAQFTLNLSMLSDAQNW